ncbi:hypothetical protein VB711_21350 [Cronbergia sp. UHCC 0137]|uniref:hypothetical protein n=1 Tax=Cronbergia sp. UHCC 0137 TaxID=3110239 RepID=UPI002B1EAEBC|nr:hypothetical protein [Cronbergia sp. UHCC 0137]MEA5620370.1 hypothetical protein [Cronbergia sp. UHCC 0137]
MMDDILFERLSELQNLETSSGEEAVREDFIKPLLELLGYKAGTEHDIERGVILKLQTGTNKTETIKPDYILSITNERKWILEAKAPNQSVLNKKHINQAHSYTNHKEVNVKLYAVCNGEDFALYLKEDPKYQPILHFKRSELIKNWSKLNNKLSVKSFDTSDKILLANDREIISPISYAESFDIHDCPCHPRDFVGRDDQRKEFWQFIHNIKDKKSKYPKRVIGFEGHSGIGKSSLILKLKAESEENNSDNLFLFQVDVKSVQTDFFAAIAIKTAIVKAIEQGFLDLPKHICNEINISDNLLFFNQLPIQQVHKTLKENNKIIIVFFDHFEYLLRQSRLLNTYNLFESLIYKISDLKPNIVLGFSWKTEISSVINEDIRFRWETLKEKIYVISIETFVPKEAQEYIDIFEIYLKEKKNKISKQELQNLYKLKVWILDKCYALPWLLRKLFAKIYKYKVDSQFPIKYQQLSELVVDMLQDDLKDLHPKVIECLKQIANESSDILAFYEQEIKILIEKRLISQNGLNYTVESILHEYIVTNQVKLPDFSISYIPKRPVYVCLEVFRMLKSVNNKQDLINKLRSSRMISKNANSKTIDNIISDLRHFFQIEYNQKNDNFIDREYLLKLDNAEIADYLAGKLTEHLIIKEINKNKNKTFKEDQIMTEIRPGYRFNRYMLKQLLKKIYSDKSIETNMFEEDEIDIQHINKQERDKFDHYTSRLLSWFYFAGLIEKSEMKPYRLLMPTNRPGKQKGKISSEDEIDKQLGLFDN